MTHYLIEFARKKAGQSNCRYKISALGFNRKGEFIGATFNIKRFMRKGGGIHAEMKLMSIYGTLLKRIIICRVNRNGDFLPIHPCKTCQKKANELNIKIITIER